MTRCPACNLPVRPSKNIVEGVTAYACVPCYVWWIDGHPEPISPGEALRDDIRKVAGIVEEKVRSRDNEAMTSDITDPRWEGAEYWAS